MAANPFVILISIIMLFSVSDTREMENTSLLREYLTSHDQGSYATSFDNDDANLEFPPQVKDIDGNNDTDGLDNALLADMHNRNIYRALRHCEIEITHRIKGVCEAIRPIGSACVSGDYMDVFNAECMLN